MENNVVTLETAKKLKAAGFPQEAFYLWRFHKPNGASILLTRENQLADNYRYAHTREASRFFEENDFIAAPTAQEIADQLPKTDGPYDLAVGWWSDFGYDKWRAGYLWLGEESGYNDRVDAPTMAEALAALWLKLREASK